MGRWQASCRQPPFRIVYFTHKHNEEGSGPRKAVRVQKNMHTDIRKHMLKINQAALPSLSQDRPAETQQPGTCYRIHLGKHEGKAEATSRVRVH